MRFFSGSLRQELYCPCLLDYFEGNASLVGSFAKFVNVSLMIFVVSLNDEDGLSDQKSFPSSLDVFAMKSPR